MWQYATLRKNVYFRSMDFRKRLMPLTYDTDELELNLSVDCVIFTIQNAGLKVLLTKLAPEMKWMLPGGFMTMSENANQAANRILKFRTGVENIYLNQFQIFSDPERFTFSLVIQNVVLSEEDSAFLEKLPKRVISIGYFCIGQFRIHSPNGWCS